MVLETIDNPQIKVGDITVEVEVPDILFDPKKDLTEEDLQLMMSRVKNVKPGRNFFIDAEAVLCMDLLDPDKVKPWKEEVWKGVEDEITKATSRSAQRSAETIGQAKILFGQRYEQLISIISSNRNSNFKTELINEAKTHPWVPSTLATPDYYGDFIESQNLFWGVIIYPDLMDSVDPEKNLGSNLKDELAEKRRQNDWYRFSRVASQLKVIYPEDYKDVVITFSDWQKMIDELSSIRRERSDLARSGKFFERHLFNMLVLYSDISITNDKFEFTFPQKKMETKTNPQPEERSF